jgi:hypothetical protein
MAAGVSARISSRRSPRKSDLSRLDRERLNQPRKAEWVMGAMMTMKKIDVQALKDAAAG